MSQQSTGLSDAERIDLTDLADADEAAQTLGVSKSTLPTWRAQGRGPVYIKSGRTIFYPRAGLRNHLRAGLTTPTPARERRLARAQATISTNS
jgi:hypothetical protein